MKSNTHSKTAFSKVMVSAKLPPTREG